MQEYNVIIKIILGRRGKMIIYTLIMCLTMVICGLLFVKRPPKEINTSIGYRTIISSKNIDTWNFAHKYAGKVWIISGIITAFIACICFMIPKDIIEYEKLMIILEIFELVMLFLVIPITEIKLRKVFNKNGVRKNN